MNQQSPKEKTILAKISLKRFNRRIYREAKKKESRRRDAESNYAKKQQRIEELENDFGKNFTYQDVIEKWLPTNLLYIIKSPNKSFNLNALSRDKIFKQFKPVISTKILYVPEWFSIIDKPQESFDFLKLRVIRHKR